MNDENILSDSSPALSQPITPWEPWRCSVCDFFVYNVDADRKPVPGAPSPRYISREYPIACSVCWSLYMTLSNSEYFSKLMLK